LPDNYFLSDAAQPFILSIAQFCLRHLNGALVVRYHHCYKVLIDVVCWLDGHVIHHLRHRLVVLQ